MSILASRLMAVAYLICAFWCSFQIFAGQTRKAESQKESWDVCRAVSEKSGKGVLLRAMALPTRDGLMLGDYTCPVAESRTSRTPAMILLKELTFVSESEEKLFEKSRRSGLRPFFQVLVKGDLDCRSDFKFHERDDGDIVAGNGFGSYGLAKCRLKNSVVLILREIDGAVST